ncbi:MAG: rod shape-determining protein MreC [Ardenticatenales bacterium]|nr:rod shape-determining protein MreC [Ardenticatenales bacterium]
MIRVRSHFIILLAMLFFALLLIVLDQGARMERPQDFGQRLVMPAEFGLSTLTRTIGGLFTSIGDIGRLRDENEALRQQLDSLALVHVQLTELQTENERLRDLLGFQEGHPNYTLEVAEIISQGSPAAVVGQEVSNLVQSVRINQGKESGVEPGMSVITAYGLVGRVLESGQGWAKVLLITDDTSRITAVVQQGRAGGVVEGTRQGLVMRYIPHEERVEPNDVVLTAGLGGQFPKGLVIGVVESVERSDINPWQEAVIRPTIDFSQLEYVFVIRSFTQVSEEEVAP